MISKEGSICCLDSWLSLSLNIREIIDWMKAIVTQFL